MVVLGVFHLAKVVLACCGGSFLEAVAVAPLEGFGCWGGFEFGKVLFLADGL